MKKLLLLTITAFLLFSFLTTNGQTNPTVTINQSAAQADPTNNAPINFLVVFDQPVVGFTGAGVNLTGTATGNLIKVATGGPTTWNVAVAGMTSCGTVIATIPAGVCTNSLTQPNLASTSTDNTVTYTPVLPNPAVTINQAAAQADPTSSSPINFTVLFDQPVTGFATGDVSLSGTAGATTGIVTGNGTTYNVAVSGMTASGTVIATIAAGVAQNGCSQPNNASTSTDNTVTINCVPPVVNVTPILSCGGVAALGCNGPLTASGNADTYTWSPLAGLYNDCIGTVPYTGDSRTVVYASPTVNTIYTVKGTKLITGCSTTATAQVNYTPPAPVITPAAVNKCISDPPVKLKVVPGSIPASPAIWSPSAGLFLDPAATIPYIAGTAIDSVWVRPTPTGIFVYQVTTTATPPITPTCTSAPRTVTVTVGLPATITSQPANQAFCSPGGAAAFSVGVSGAGMAFQWQMSTSGGAFWNNISNGGAFSGVNTPTLTINPVTIGMDGYLFKLVISSCSGNIFSNAASINFNPIPTVTIAANPLIIGPAQSSTISSTVTPNPATTYTWYYNNAVLPGATSANLIVNYGSPGDYQLKVTDANNCGVGVSNLVTIANSFALNMFTYPNPGSGIFQVIYHHDPNGATNNTLQRSLAIYNNWGGKIMTKVFPITTNFQKIDVDIRAHGKGIYWVELKDANGARLGMSRVLVQ